MDFPVPNRQRRRSNLGRRNRFENPTQLVPVFQVPAPRGLGRSVLSANKRLNRAAVPKASDETSLFAKKRLFLLSPQNSASFSNYSQDENLKTTGDVRTNLAQKLSTISLNETGVQVLLTTPSPVGKQNLFLTQSLKKDCNKVERPKSLGMSQYNQLILSEFVNSKRPVDPEDIVDQVKLSPKTSPLKQEDIKKELNLQSNPTEKEKNSPNTSFVYNEDLDTTDSFIFAEQTIIDQNQTLTESFQIKEAVNSTKSAQKQSKPLEPVLEEEIESDTEDELLQQTLSKLNVMMVEIEKTKKIVHSIINKRIKRKTKTENKENVAMTANKPIKEKWMSELKTGNPALLKTPKPLDKQRFSLAEQSITWTPHSLSTVLCDQMDELFE